MQVAGLSIGRHWGEARGRETVFVLMMYSHNNAEIWCKYLDLFVRAKRVENSK